MDPISEDQLLDETKPAGCDQLSSIDELMRENREAINLLFNSMGTGACLSVQLALGDNVLEVDSSAMIVVSTASGNAASISGLVVDEEILGARVVVIMVNPNNGSDLVTLTHQDDIFCMQDGRDSVLGAGDFIIMQFCNLTTCQEIEERIVSGTWHEVGRTQARTPIGGLRFWPAIDKYGALTTEGI